MATTTVEIAESLAPEDTPIKLRCASCNKLVLNAFRLPCCDQSICESCQTSLPDTCPVCAHSPLSPANCKPNKALRLTVKAFLKNEEKKREKERAAALQVAETPPQEAPQEAATPTLPNTASEDSSLARATTRDPDVIAENNPVLQTVEIPGPASNQIREDTLDSVEKEQVVHEDTSLQSATQVAEAGEQSVAQPSKDEGRPIENGEARKDGENYPSQQAGDDGSAYNQMPNGYGSMNWNAGGFNPMMTMQSGMNQSGWNGFNNTMGVPGMSMDPMAMYQGMFGGFNGQSMGMNGMNMGMGFNGGFTGGWGMGGMNGDFGANAGYYPGSGYNQQSHQGHFNQMHDQQFQMNSYQNRSHQGSQGFHHQRGRSHGRWTGSQDFDKVSHVQPSREQARDDSTPHLSASGRDENLKEASSEAKDNLEGALTAALDENLPADGVGASAHSAVETTSKAEGEMASPAMTANIDFNVTNNKATTIDESFGDVQTPQLKPIESLDTAGLASSDTDMTPISAMPPSIDPAVPTGPSTTYGAPSSQDLAYFGRGRGGMRGYTRASFDHRGGHRGRGGYYVNAGMAFASSNQTQPIEPLGQGVVGAPKGPKAMREGQPLAGFRGRGALHGRGGRAGSVAPTPIPRASSSAIAIAASRSRSRTRSRSSSRPRRRGSPVYLGQQKNDEDDQLEHGRTNHRSRRGSSPAEGDQRNGEEPRSRRDSEGVENRHRSRHHSERHRSSRKDRDYDREKERDRKRRKRDHSEDRYGHEEDEHDLRRSSKDHHSHHEKERDHEYREKRSRRKERHRDRERRSHHDRSRSRSSERVEDGQAPAYDRSYSTSHDYTSSNSRPRPEFANDRGPPPSAPTGPASSRREVHEFKIQGRSKMQPPARPSVSSANVHEYETTRPAPPTGPKSDLDIAKQQVRAEKPDMDEHALEREARNRERLLKEQQRRGYPANGGERKRSFGMMEGDKNGDDGEASGSGNGRKSSRGGRRVSYQYEGEDEDRAARVEREREAERWR